MVSYIGEMFSVVDRARVARRPLLGAIFEGSESGRMMSEKVGGVDASTKQGTHARKEQRRARTCTDPTPSGAGHTIYYPESLSQRDFGRWLRSEYTLGCPALTHVFEKAKSKHKPQPLNDSYL